MSPGETVGSCRASSPRSAASARAGRTCPAGGALEDYRDRRVRGGCGAVLLLGVMCVSANQRPCVPTEVWFGSSHHALATTMLCQGFTPHPALRFRGSTGQTEDVARAVQLEGWHMRWGIR